MPVWVACVLILSALAPVADGIGYAVSTKAEAQVTAIQKLVDKTFPHATQTLCQALSDNANAALLVARNLSGEEKISSLGCLLHLMDLSFLELILFGRHSKRLKKIFDKAFQQREGDARAWETCLTAFSLHVFLRLFEKLTKLMRASE